MWGKTLGKVIDICLVSGLISITAMAVTKAVVVIRDEIKGGKTNGSGDPE